MERLGDRLGNYYSTWLASSLSCCMPRLQEQSEERTELHFEPGVVERPTRQSPIPGMRLLLILMCQKQLKPITVSKYNVQITSQQPRALSRMSWPEIKSEVHRTWSKKNSRDTSQCTVEQSSQASHASRTAWSSSRPRPSSRTRRPTIGAPTDFRQSSAESNGITLPFQVPRPVSPPLRKLSPFRPIQLSIYLPGHELPVLPTFSNEKVEDEDEEKAPGIMRPPSAFLKPQEDGKLLRSNTSFSITRKPVPSRSSQTEPVRYSTESNFTLYDSGLGRSSQSLEYVRLQKYDHRPSVATTKSAQEFLEIINAPLPPLPKPSVSTQQPQIGYSIYRRASEQSLRLRTHLEERQALERDCETISEERSPSDLIAPTLITTIVNQVTSNELQDRPVSALEPTETVEPGVETPARPVSPLDDTFARPYSPQRSFVSSNTLLDSIDEKQGRLYQSPVHIQPIIMTTSQVSSADSSRPPSANESRKLAVSSSYTATLSRQLTQWLHRSLTASHSHLRSRRPPSTPASAHKRSSSHLQWNAVHSAPNERVIPGETNDDSAFPPLVNDHSVGVGVSAMDDAEAGHAVLKTRPRSHTHGSSVSTYVTTRGLSIDLEKFPIPIVRDVGVAI